MIILRQKSFAKKGGGSDKNKKGEDNLSDVVIGGSILGTVGGLKTINKDKLIGEGERVNRYHVTNAENVDSIKNKGILSKYAEDPNNLTNRVLQDVDMKDKKGLTYMAKNRSGAEGVGNAKSLRGMGDQRIIEINMSPEEYAKLNKVPNPELAGAKSTAEFGKVIVDRSLKNEKVPEYYKKILRKQMKDGYDFHKLNKVDQENVKLLYKSLGEGSDVVKGNIESKYIKGGKGYTKQRVKDFVKYAERNPGKVGAEVGKVAVPVAIGSAAAYHKYKQGKKSKK